MTNLLKEKGVLHQFSCAYRPEQNAVVERKHQHLLNIARALYFQSKVPISLWGECVATATFILNRIPSPLLKSKTPYEMLFGKTPDYYSLRTFGCLCYASTIPSLRHKFSPRAIPSVFVGYPVGYKGYKLYNLQSKQFFISRDVQFHEHIYPFQLVPSSAPVMDPFVDLAIPLPQADIFANSPQPNDTLHAIDNTATAPAPL